MTPSGSRFGPVSDPNIFSQTQRIALAQTRYQIWKENPSYFRGSRC
jgi:hypothetical protein